MSDEQREEFALAPAARAVGPMRVARAEESPWDTPPARDSCGTVRWIGDSLSVSAGLPGPIVRKGPVREDRALRGRDFGRDQAFCFSSAAFSASARAFSSAAWIRSSSRGCSSSISFSESIPSYQAVLIG